MSTQTPTTDQRPVDDITARMIQEGSHVTFNLGQNVIATTEDKIRLCLIEHLQRMGKKNSWTTPLGILLTISAILPTTTFKNFIIEADVWKAIFILSWIISLIWFLKCMREAWTNTSVDKVIEDNTRSSSQNTSEQ